MNSQNYKIIKQFEGDPTAANEEVEWLEKLWRRVEMLGALPYPTLFQLALKYRDKDKAPMPDFTIKKLPEPVLSPLDGRTKKARAIREEALTDG